MLVGPGKWVVLIVVLLVLFSYRKLPDMSRSVGRSLRIFKGELRGLGENDVRTKATAPSKRGPLGSPTRQTHPTTDDRTGESS